MIQTVYYHDFYHAFQRIHPDNFSREGLQVLFDHLEQLEDDIGEETELDVIAFCCEYSEDPASYIADQYRIELDPDADEDDQKKAVVDYLQDQGVYIGETDETIIYRQF